MKGITRALFVASSVLMCSSWTGIRAASSRSFSGNSIVYSSAPIWGVRPSAILLLQKKGYFGRADAQRLLGFMIAQPRRTPPEEMRQGRISKLTSRRTGGVAGVGRIRAGLAGG